MGRESTIPGAGWPGLIGRHTGGVRRPPVPGRQPSWTCRPHVPRMFRPSSRSDVRGAISEGSTPMKTLGCRSLPVLFALLTLATPAPAQRAVILVRHAEKETDPAKLVGLDDRQIPLSEAGETRADA